jgi:hypothetical protein
MGRRVRVGTVPSRESTRTRLSQRGAVTAETAMVLPLLVALTIALAWLLTLGIAQVRAVDAARETARALARDESESVAIGLGRQAAPEGARIEVSHSGNEVVVVVTSTVHGPGGLLSGLPAVDVRARAVAAMEEP